MNSADVRRTIVKACRGLRVKRTASDFDAMAEAARFIAHSLSVGKSEPAQSALDMAGFCLSAGDDDAIQLVTIGLFEDLGNLISHDADGPSSDLVRDLLDPLGIVAWDNVDRLWNSVADSIPEIDAFLERTGRHSKRLTETQVLQVKNAELRQFVELTHRRVEGRGLVGLPDVVIFEGMHGGGPHLGKVGSS